MRRSASSVGMFERCPHSWQFRHLRQLRFQTAWSIKGGAIHEALRHYYQRLLDDGQRLGRAEVLELFCEAVRARLAAPGRETHGEAVWFNGESPDQVLEDGLAQLRVYLDQIAPTITPLAVEERLAMTLPSGLEVVGFIDLVDSELNLRDSKFGADIPREADIFAGWQVPIYAALWKAQTGAWPRGFVLDVVSRGRAKSPKPVVAQIAVPLTPRFIEARLADFELIAAEMETGRYPRRPSQMNCSKCPYRMPCWGDLVPWGTRPTLDTPSLEPILRRSLEAIRDA